MDFKGERPLQEASCSRIYSELTVEAQRCRKHYLRSHTVEAILLLICTVNLELYAFLATSRNRIAYI